MMFGAVINVMYLYYRNTLYIFLKYVPSLAVASCFGFNYNFLKYFVKKINPYYKY